MSRTPLHELALLSDCGSAALVTAAGSVEWFSPSRFDAAPVFARLLDDEAGHFSIRPVGEGWTATWRYVGHSLVLETTWTHTEGELVVTDALALGDHERGHELGHTAPGALVRHVRGTRGRARVRVEFAPRPEYGLVRPGLSSSAGAVMAEGGATVVTLSTSMDLTVEGATATGEVDLVAGDDHTFAVEQHDAWRPQPSLWKPRQVRRRLVDTEKAWASWSRLHQNYDGPHRELVFQSGVVLRGLTFARSGAIVAAPTTSLPEGVGSGRTWDYRYTWVRDASMTMQGLFVAACPDEAGRFFSYLSRASASQLHDDLPLQIMFGVGGERELSERELPHLSGWRNSGPVRVGNDAWRQQQLDVYGSVLDAAYTLRHQLGDIDPRTRDFLVAAVRTAASRWQETDQGIWEFRGAPQHFLYSKLMCWVALDRGVKLAATLRVEDETVRRWTTDRDQIHDSILQHGWNERLGAYTQAYGSDELDASSLMLAIVGFLPGSDRRLRSTIDAIERGLSDERGLLYRYRGDDGFDAAEGTFLLCTFWLAHALAVTGQVDRSHDVLDRAASCATSLGLFSEQVDPESRELLGNFPQAFSHLGLVNAAQALVEAEAGAARRQH